MKIVNGESIEDVKVGAAGVIFEEGDSPETVEKVLGELGFFEGCEDDKRPDGGTGRR
jgi:hypothetical protein